MVTSSEVSISNWVTEGHKWWTKFREKNFKEEKFKTDAVWVNAINSLKNEKKITPTKEEAKKGLVHLLTSNLNLSKKVALCISAELSRQEVERVESSKKKIQCS